MTITEKVDEPQPYARRRNAVNFRYRLASSAEKVGAVPKDSSNGVMAFRLLSCGDLDGDKARPAISGENLFGRGLTGVSFREIVAHRLKFQG